MATPTHQRVFIIVLAIVMLVGTVGSFAGLILANNNQTIDAERAENDYAKQLEEYEKQLNEERKKNQPLAGYSADSFDVASVEKLAVEVLKPGSGKTLEANSTILANYFGWQADGTIFDSTKKVDAEVKPIEFSLEQGIEGWQQGLKGQKVGSTVKLSIPAEQAYGEQAGFGQPSGPLKFIVEIKEIVE